MKVIIADDSNTMRRVLANMLAEAEGCQFDCLMADGGDVVLQHLDEHPDVGLILLDWNMNVMNGLDCLRAIRAREDGTGAKPVPVVMITAETMRNRILETLQAGASNYLVKPFSPEKLHSVLAPFLNK